jgi:hypothetical protein
MTETVSLDTTINELDFRVSKLKGSATVRVRQVPSAGA